MTDQPITPQNDDGAVAPSRLQPVKGSRLDELLARYDGAKAAAADAEAALKALTTAIKAELAAARPNDVKIEVESPNLAAPLAMTYKESWRIDSKRLKVEQPLIYATYANKSGSWDLRAVKGGEV